MREERRPIGSRHLRSIFLFGWFGFVDLALLVFALRTATLWPLVLRTALMLLVLYLAQPFSSVRPWSSRQALIGFNALLMPGVGSFVAAFWSSQVGNLQGAWQDMPKQLPVYRSAIDWNDVLDVVPLIDVLEGEDTALKKRTLLHLQTMRSSIEAKVVRQALSDADPEVRYYAASLLSHAEAVHTARINDIERELDRRPEDATLWNELAAVYRALIVQDIAGAELNRFYQEKRWLALERSLRLQPEQPMIGLQKADALFALGRIEEAEGEAMHWLSTYIAPQILDRARAVLIRVAYARGDQEGVREWVRGVQDPAHLPDDVRGLVELRRSKGV
ncbi:MAG TPA: hypothetical protein VFV52_12485 [Bacilli bacterium]|nr:hypothetical protein [Bacilli bacterium]